jgi:predicted TIM-barrel fold metal-dependent hydrolase
MYEGVPIALKRINASVGLPLDLRENVPVTYEDVRPGCWDVTERLADMDINHMEASLCFPTMPRFCGQTFAEGKDKELGLACLKVYNDYLHEEWCGPSGGRLIPLGLVPLWDAELAAAEVRRNAARGFTAVAFCEIPAFLGLPSIHSGFWDPFFRACAETETTICMHVGSSSKMPATSADAPAAVGISLSFNNAMASLSDYIFSGILIRHPNLKLAYSESQIGWIPYALMRMDDVWNQHRAWIGLGDSIPEPPSTYYYRQVYGCFFRDDVGVKNLDLVGVNNATFEVDYPHTDSTWPDTKKLAEDHFAHLSQKTIYKICRGNAIRMLRLDLDQDLDENGQPR